MHGLFYIAILVQKLKFPLTAFILSETEYKSIMHTSIKADLPRALIAANLNTAVRDGPIGSRGGVSYISSWLPQEQYIS